MDAYKYTKSFELYDRAEKVIPCGIYGHLGVGRSRLNPMGSYPLLPIMKLMGTNYQNLNIYS